MEAKQVLIIENEEDIRKLIECILVYKGFGVCIATDGEQGLHEFAMQHFDLVLLDIMMPQMSGWEVLRQLRRRSDVPVIIISALFRDEYVTYAAQQGANYLMKPFGHKELLAAVETALPWITQSPDKTKIEQSNGQQATPLTGNAAQPGAAPRQRHAEVASDSHKDTHLQIDLATRQVLVQGKRVKLTGTEFRLLEYLFRHANQVLTYQQILDAVWGWEYRNSTHYVHVFISQLRQKLEADPEEPRYLLTERGVGYWFVA